MNDTMTTVDGDTEIRTLDIEVPRWIDQDLTIYDVDSINQDGCVSGAYIPAVTYYKAMQTMANHGDDVLDYIYECIGELPQPQDTESWSGLAVHYLSYAVELFATAIEDDIEQYNRD